MDIAVPLAALHHVLAFGVVAILAVEIALVRPGLSPETARSVTRIDLLYGVGFGLLLAIGLARAIWFEKGWAYYAGSWAFWAKLALLAAVTVLSLPPTLRFLAWARTGRTDPGFVPPLAEIAAVRRWMLAEAAILPGVPVLAAMVARGW